MPPFLFLDNIVLGGLQIINVSDFLEFVLRLTLNTLVILALVRWLYFTKTRRKDYLFTFILIATIVFLLCYLLESVKLQIGFALGLFAIFGIIRYRTDAIPIKEMTYLFIVIGLSVINALSDSDATLADLLFTNLVILSITYVLERVSLLRHESSKQIVYEKIELIQPERYDELLKDVTARTGIKNIKRIETGKINLLKDTCILTVFYDSENGSVNIPYQTNDQDDE